MVKEEKVKRELHCEDYGSCQKWEGGEEEKCHSSYQRSYLSTHDLKTVV